MYINNYRYHDNIMHIQYTDVYIYYIYICIYIYMHIHTSDIESPYSYSLVYDPKNITRRLKGTTLCLPRVSLRRGFVHFVLSP